MLDLSFMYTHVWFFVLSDVQSNIPDYQMALHLIYVKNSKDQITSQIP